MTALRRIFSLVAILGVVLPTTAGAFDPVRCLKASGNAATRCLHRTTAAVEKCRLRGDAGCEEALRAPGGRLEDLRLAAGLAVEPRCTAEEAEFLGYTGAEDVVFRQPEACTDWGEDSLGLEFAADLSELSSDALDCQRRVVRSLSSLRKRVILEFGPRCFARAFAGGICDRSRRDERVSNRRARALDRIVSHCGAAFDDLGLVSLDTGSSPEDRAEIQVDTVIERARHFAQRVYPPNDLGPTADFGPFPIGVRTLPLVDPARSHVTTAGPRPVVTEVYYPSTEAAVAGLPRDIVRVLGIEIVATPAFRDVDAAAGDFPLIVFSHGNGGLRFQSFYFAAHLASHGFIVVTADHHGNTFIDAAVGVVDAASAVNRPLDVTFLIDTFLAFDALGAHFLEGRVDESKIGVSGHSFGGYTTFAVAGGPFALGTFTDPRVDAIFPQAPAAFGFDEAFFASIDIPTLIVGGSIDETTPFETDQQRPFDHLPSGASVVGLAKLEGGGHFTFSDFCEVDRTLLAFLGGFEEACEPRHLPWRHAHDIANFLALNFFRGTLQGDAASLARLDPAALESIEDLVYSSK